MKSILFFVFSFQLIPVFSKELIELKAAYEIVSDSYDAKIQAGSYVVEATVYDYQTKQKLAGVRIESLTKKRITDANGWFKLTTPISENYFSLKYKNYPRAFWENYAIKNKHHLKMKIFLRNEENYIEPDVAEKPVIYCYSEQPIYFDLTLHTVGKLSFAYPLFNQNQTWSMKLENSELTDANSPLKYPYLFWESQQEGVHFKGEIFKQDQLEIDASVVPKSQVVLFLDSTLTVLGFNSHEKTDFITYWGPRMQHANYYVIQFLQNTECEQFAQYEISPKPTHLNRFYMLFTGVETNESLYLVHPQILKPLERNGFYLVDWGGIELKKNTSLTY